MATKSKMVCLDYTFLFSKEANIWNKLSEFERDLAIYFASQGLEAEPITTIDGSNGPRMIMIRKIEDYKLTNLKGPALSNMSMKGMKSSKIVDKMVDQANKSYKGGKK